MADGTLHQFVDAIIRCTRALILAHFDTAAAQPDADPSLHAIARGPQFIGVDTRVLTARKRSQTITDTEWDEYLVSWAAMKGPSLSYPPPGEDADGRQPELFHIRWQRSRGGRYRNARPAVLYVAERLLAGRIPGSLLLDLYRQNLRTAFALEDSPAFHLFALDWLAKLNGISESVVDRSTLLTLIERSAMQAGTSEDLAFPAEKCTSWSAGLTEVLESLAILQFTDRNYGSYGLRFKADAAFVQANLFGRSTGIEGLDYLFYGGIWVPNAPDQQRNCVVTIEGPTGVGKSMTALSCAMQACARGAYCLLFSFEVGDQGILSQAAQLCRHLMPYVRILNQTGRTLYAPPSGSAIGKLVISDISADSPQSLRSATFAEALKEAAASHEERWIIFDSIGVSKAFGKGGSEWRQFLYEMTSILRGFGYVVLIVLEKDHEMSGDVEEFLADVAIRFERSEASPNSYNVRTIEIAKTRFQRSHRGAHLYSVQSGTGLHVFPSSSAVLASRLRRESRVGFTDRTSLDPGVEFFARYFGGKNVGDDNKVPFWLEGSTTVLHGPRGCMKRTFSSLFCRKHRDDDEMRPVSLSMQFGGGLIDSPQPLSLDMLRPNPFGYRYDVPLEFGPIPDKIVPSSAYVMFRTGHLASGHVLKVIGDLIVEKRRQQTPIRRASITGLGSITSLFPLLREDVAFIPALCDMLSSEGITILLDYSLPHDGAKDMIGEQVLSLADNIITFTKVTAHDNARVQIQVDRSSDSSHNNGIYELRPALDPDGVPCLQVAPLSGHVLDAQGSAVGT